MEVVRKECRLVVKSGDMYNNAGSSKGVREDAARVAGGR